MHTFVADDEILLVLRDGLVENGRIVVLVRGNEVVLVELDRHPDSWSHDLPEEIHVGKDPFVAHRGDPEIALEEGVQPVQEELDRGQVDGGSRRRPQGTPTQQAEGEAQRHQGRLGVAVEIRAPPLQTVVDPLAVNRDKRRPGTRTKKNIIWTDFCTN